VLETGSVPEYVFQTTADWIYGECVEVFQRGSWECIASQLLTQPEQFIFQCLYQVGSALHSYIGRHKRLMQETGYEGSVLCE
jgi:hypothetical protein